MRGATIQPMCGVTRSVTNIDVNFEWSRKDALAPDVVYSFNFGDRLYTLESDVYRRLILTFEVDPRTVRVKYS